MKIDKCYIISVDYHSNKTIINSIIKTITKLNIFNYSIGSIIDQNPYLGLLKSNTEIILDAQFNKHDNIIVFEDDCVFCNGFIEKYNNYISNIPDDWCLLNLGTEIYDSKYIEPINENILRTHSSLKTHAMIYNIKKYGDVIFETLITEVINKNKIYKPIDILLAYEVMPNYPCYIPNEILCFQNPRFSSLAKKHVDYTKSFHKANKILKYKTNVKYMDVVNYNSKNIDINEINIQLNQFLDNI